MQAVDTQTMSREEARERALQERIKAGYVLEDPSEMTPRYREALVSTIHIAADLEVMVLPTYLPAIRSAPTLEDKIAVASACQDELGHAQVMYRILEEFGYDTNEFLMVRDPAKWRTFQMVEYPHQDYIDFVVSLCYGDRAGYITTQDLEEHCSFGPYARSLRKVNFEEKFHVGHGERWVKFFWNHSPQTRARVQKAVDFYFPLCAAWFGMPDHLKKRTDQILYKIRGSSNDEMRQKWLQQIVPFSEAVGIRVPAHLDAETGRYVLDYQPPIHLDEETHTWDYDRRITWEEQLAIWKRGSPFKLDSIRRLQLEVWGDGLWA
ncbi:1,2-phenylacetyl-CoA epoxidase subunit PaaC [Azospirillum sp. ST 5-10]|uniref:1,2-phenylacetyl-CoA epoxidase subunit PaaC n=1 Tax=unclassified Azospirillum TaxID=2630922 RepID=UPI003F4A20FB